MPISLFWFRRDLRLDDNVALTNALSGNDPVLPVFIFDKNILAELPADDARIQFIHEQLQKIHKELNPLGSGIKVLIGQPKTIFEQLIQAYKIRTVFFNRDYEPYALQRDKEISSFLKEKGIEVANFKDQVLLEKDEILKSDGTPYTVYTPYKNKWLAEFSERPIPDSAPELKKENFLTFESELPSLQEIGFEPSGIEVKQFRLSQLSTYSKERDFPALNATTNLSPHLRFGTVSIRDIIRKTKDNPVFLSELIWREFFMQILYHFPHVVDQSFRPKYDKVPWRNDTTEFEKWCRGETGYPMVDAGMRELNQTGYMHNRVRMITASFLCKHLLIDWRWGEAYFARKLLDYELSSNNGNWQWAAGTGCDAAPYFRVFNPTTQLQKFDKDKIYIRKWLPEYGTSAYPKPIVDHKMARERAISTYKEALS